MKQTIKKKKKKKKKTSKKEGNLINTKITTQKRHEKDTVNVKWKTNFGSNKTTSKRKKFTVKKSTKK